MVRARVVNPKWIAGVMRHGYKGAFEMAATVDQLFAYRRARPMLSPTTISTRLLRGLSRGRRGAATSSPAPILPRSREIAPRFARGDSCAACGLPRANSAA